MHRFLAMANTQPDPLTQASSQVASQASSAVGDRGVKRGRDGPLKAYHSPWDTPPNHVIDCTNGRCRVDEMSNQDLWAYMEQPTKVLQFRTECPRVWARVVLLVVSCRLAGDRERQGVAISKSCQVLAFACARLGESSNPLFRYESPACMRYCFGWSFFFVNLMSCFWFVCFRLAGV